MVGQRVIKYWRKHYCGNSIRLEVLKENTSGFFLNLISILCICSTCAITTDENFTMFLCAEERSENQLTLEAKSTILRFKNYSLTRAILMSFSPQGLHTGITKQ